MGRGLKKEIKNDEYEKSSDKLIKKKSGVFILNENTKLYVKNITIEFSIYSKNKNDDFDYTDYIKEHNLIDLSKKYTTYYYIFNKIMDQSQINDFLSENYDKIIENSKLTSFKKIPFDELKDYPDLIYKIIKMYLPKKNREEFKKFKYYHWIGNNNIDLNKSINIPEGKILFDDVKKILQEYQKIGRYIMKIENYYYDIIEFSHKCFN